MLNTLKQLHLADFEELLTNVKFNLSFKWRSCNLSSETGVDYIKVTLTRTVKHHSPRDHWSRLAEYLTLKHRFFTDAGDHALQKLLELRRRHTYTYSRKIACTSLRPSATKTKKRACKRQDRLAQKMMPIFLVMVIIISEDKNEEKRKKKMIATTSLCIITFC